MRPHLGQRDGFLQAFPWNPVTDFLKETRRSILTEMERQGISIDAARLTDVNLLKRHVLKRCIYGVDLNPMAVELAKVSLWLDCFTLGAPLSFLDHHLKCGNSLIGTTVQEVEAELAVLNKGHVGDLFGGPFQGLLTSTYTMLEIARSPDATVEQAERSHSLFAEFEKSQAPYKRALDIWVSRHFGNNRAQDYLRLADANLVDQIRSGGQGLVPEHQEVITNAVKLTTENRFFHWDLEFPEAFVDLERNTWRIKEQQGFDAVVGNPPWGGLLSDSSLSYLRGSFSARGWNDSYAFFIQMGIRLSRHSGHFGMIVPSSWLTVGIYQPLRA